MERLRDRERDAEGVNGMGQTYFGKENENPNENY